MVCVLDDELECLMLGWACVWQGNRPNCYNSWQLLNLHLITRQLFGARSSNGQEASFTPVVVYLTAVGIR